jgi:hypothetical protein
MTFDPYNKPENWKPTDTEVDIPDVGVVRCSATFDHSEDEGTGKHYRSFGDTWVPNERTHWTVQVIFEHFHFNAPYSQGSAYDKPPTADYVLSALVSDAQCGEYDFAEFCASLGYDEDSRKAEQAWHACRDTELSLRRMFGARYDALSKWGAEQ